MFVRHFLFTVCFKDFSIFCSIGTHACPGLWCHSCFLNWLCQLGIGDLQFSVMLAIGNFLVSVVLPVYFNFKAVSNSFVSVHL